jgi:HAD superfamily hydrolase (TIGR01490 family)
MTPPALPRVRTVGIAVKPGLHPATSHLLDIEQWLASRGVHVVFETTTAELLPAAAARQFADGELRRFIRPEAIARIHWHRQRGDRCIVVTASPGVYVQAWATAEGLECIGSRLEVDTAGRLTGRHDGLVCDGAEKARRLHDAIGALDVDVYAYGDSRGDREMLALARHAFFRDMPPPERA